MDYEKDTELRISIRSLKIELAVSMPPAPLPMIVCFPECSEVNVMAFNVPLTHRGSFFERRFGRTSRVFPSQLAINLIASLFLARPFHVQ